MKSKVIFYCVLVFCSELVASVPYAADLQRYSGSFSNIPSLERSVQGNVPRPYQSVNQFSHDDGLYNSPNLQYQELPRINRDSYFSQSPRVSIGSVFPESYADSSAQKEWQNINLQIQKRPIQSFPDVQHQNNRFINERPSTSAINKYNIEESSIIGSLLTENRKLEQLVNQAASKPRNPIQLSNAPLLHGLSEPFFPQIPSIPVENSYRNNEQFIPPLDEHFLQNTQPLFLNEEYSAPAVSQNRPEYTIPHQPIERLQARAGNPVEYIPAPVKPVRPQKHNFEQIFKFHPNIQNVLSNSPNTKRYLVVHPNGTVESVDSLQSVAQQNPNYVLIKAGDVAPKLPSSTEQPEIPIAVTEKPVPVIVGPTIVPVTLSTKIDVEKKSSVPLQITTKQPPAAVPNVIISHTVIQETIVSSTEQTPSTIIPTSTSSTDKIEVTTEKSNVGLNSDSERITKIGNLQNSTNSPTETPVISYTEQPSNSTISSETQTIKSSTAPSNTIQQTQSNNVVPDSQNNTLIPTSNTIALERKNGYTQNSTVVNTTTQSPSTPYTQTIVSSTTPPSIIQKIQSNNDVPVSQNKTLIPTSSTIAPETYNQVNDSSSVLTNQNKSVTTNTTQTVTTSPISAISATENKNTTTSDAQEEEVKYVGTTVSPISNIPVTTPTRHKKVTDRNISTVPNLGSLDISKVKAKNKPAVWFRTTDPNFWNKLTEGNETFDVIYFFQIQNQPKVERDITKIIHPNGTIVEELTETVWENDSDEPKVRKTSKIINPEEA